MLNMLNAAFTPLRQKGGALSLTQRCPPSVSEVKAKLQQLRISRVWKNTLQNCVHGSQFWAGWRGWRSGANAVSAWQLLLRLRLLARAHMDQPGPFKVVLPGLNLIPP